MYAVNASTTGCGAPSGRNRGTRSDSEKVNLAQVEFLFFKRGPTTFCFIP
jgi:hypothetical protein